jgi:hypothetical protein
VSGRAGTPVIGAIILSSASAMDFALPVTRVESAA